MFSEIQLDLTITLTLLRAAGCDLGTLDDHERSALHLAAMTNAPNNVLNVLCDFISVHIQDDTGCTALHIATSSRAARVLLRHNANVDARDILDRTPLMHAAKHGRLALVRLLLDTCASIEFRDTHGESALHIAAEQGHTDIVATLHDNGAPLDTNSNLDWTPLMIARVEGAPRDDAPAARPRRTRRSMRTPRVSSVSEHRERAPATRRSVVASNRTVATLGVLLRATMRSPRDLHDAARVPTPLAINRTAEYEVGDSPVPVRARDDETRLVPLRR